jgi:[acyl-carrier-protein] S-malonyltransferase
MTSEKILALFPGQGSQKVGMGKDWFERFKLAQGYFRQADEVLGLGLSKLCFEGPLERLTATEIAQPAILTVSSICYAAEQEKGGGQNKPCAAAGHSLGEYSALVAAGALKFEDAVLLVHKRGKFMQEAVPAGQGKMIAVLGQELSVIEQALGSVSSGVAEVANVNAPGQVVLAGDKPGIEAFMAAMPGAKMVELQVSAPFHCKLMAPAAERLKAELAKIMINAPAFPVYSNFYGRALSNPEEIRAALYSQVCGRIRWVECMQNAIRDHSPAAAIEYGAGSVLSGLLKRIEPKLARKNVESPA